MVDGTRRSRLVGLGSRAGVFRRSAHPALVHLPIGAWASSLVFDVASRFVHRPAYLALGSRWLIAIGLLGAVAAACAGLLDLAAIERGAGAFRTACTHMFMNVLLIFAYTGNLAWRFRSHPVGAPVGTGMLALSASCAVTLAVSCYLGGKLSYGYGARATAPVIQVGQDREPAAYPAPPRPVPRHRADRP